MARAELKPHERAQRDKEELAAFGPLIQRGEALAKEAMVKQAQDRKEAGLPAEEPKQGQGQRQ